MAGPLDADIQIAAASKPPKIASNIALDDATILVVEWFGENFESPAQSTPYESREGGYQYIWGGPYETDDILDAAFGDEMSDELRSEVKSILENESDVWVPNSSRILAPSEDFGATYGLDDVHAQMLQRVEAVERALAEIDKARRGIGHNRPPEPLNDEPLNEVERREMGEALATLRSQPIEPAATAFLSIENAIGTIKAAAAKVSAWLGARLSDFTIEAIKSAGKVAGSGVAGWGLWKQLDGDLQALVAAALKWATIINPPF